MVCSNAISVGEALRKAHERGKLLKEEETYDETDGSLDSVTGIIYRAVGILRRRMACVKDMDGDYPSAGETSAEELKRCTDPLLYRAVCWFTNKKTF